MADCNEDCPTTELVAARARRSAEGATDRNTAAGEVRPPTPEIAVGSILRSRYILEQIIGRGGDSIVFRARDLHRVSADEAVGKFVAVKVLLPAQCPNVHALTRLKREFQQMQRLSHPGIVRVFDLDCDGDIWFMSMELVAARSLKARLRTPVSHAEGVRIIAACCEALEYAHSLGILHGDLKPSNVLMAGDGRVRLIDFGSTPGPVRPLASGSDPSVAATPIYASPQLLAGSGAERRDDIFSLACLSYGILAGGAHPFGGKSSLDAYRSQMTPLYVPTIPGRLFEVIARALAAEREQRPASVGEFLRDLTGTGLCRSVVPANAVSIAAAVKQRSGIEVLKAPSRVVAIGQCVGDGRGGFWRADRHWRLMALGVLSVGAAVLLGHGVYPSARPGEAPAPAVSTAPDLVATALARSAPPPTPAAAAQPDVVTPARAASHAAGIISFEAPTLRASAGQSLVAISVKRLQSTRNAAAFVWRIERGTAQPDIDYERLGPQVVRFIEGQAVRSLFIPLLQPRATLAALGPRTFTVALEQTAGGPALGRFARVTVTIEPTPVATRYGIYQARAGQ
jgi:tRNA A-37 threonylcarbamoyl transferase component Bud32